MMHKAGYNIFVKQEQGQQRAHWYGKFVASIMMALQQEFWIRYGQRVIVLKNGVLPYEKLMLIHDD